MKLTNPQNQYKILTDYDVKVAALKEHQMFLEQGICHFMFFLSQLKKKKSKAPQLRGAASTFTLQ